MILQSNLAVSPDDQCPFIRQGDKIDPRKLRSGDRAWIGAQIAHKLSTVDELHKRYGISKDRLRIYHKKIARGRSFLDGAGRPRVIDKIGEENLLTTLTSGSYLTTHKEFKELFKNEAEATAVRRGDTRLQLLPVPRADVDI